MDNRENVNTYTVRDVAVLVKKTRQHVNRVCRQTFGPANGYRRKFSEAEFQRLQRIFNQYTRRH